MATKVLLFACAVLLASSCEVSVPFRAPSEPPVEPMGVVVVPDLRAGTLARMVEPSVRPAPALQPSMAGAGAEPEPDASAAAEPAADEQPDAGAGEEPAPAPPASMEPDAGCFREGCPGFIPFATCISGSSATGAACSGRCQGSCSGTCPTVDGLCDGTCVGLCQGTCLVCK